MTYKRRTISCVYLSMRSKFWASRMRLYNVDSADKFFVRAHVRYFFRPVCPRPNRDRLVDLAAMRRA